MTFFAVEVDHFVGADDTGAVMVPRTAFVPSWATTGTTGRSPLTPAFADALAAGAEATRDAVARLDELAPRLGLIVQNSKAARHYRPARGQSGISVYPSDGKAYWDLASLRASGDDPVADGLRDALSALARREVTAQQPGIGCDALLVDWDAAVATVIEPYFAARGSMRART